MIRMGKSILQKWVNYVIRNKAVVNRVETIRKKQQQFLSNDKELVHSEPKSCLRNENGKQLDDYK